MNCSQKSSPKTPFSFFSMSFRTPFWHFFANFLFHFVFFYPQIFYQNQGVSLIAHNGFFLVSFFCSLLPPWKFRFLFLAFFVDFIGFFLVSFLFFKTKKPRLGFYPLTRFLLLFGCLFSVFLLFFFGLPLFLFIRFCQN